MTIVCVYIVEKVKPKKYICKTYNKRGASVNDLTFVTKWLRYERGGNTTSQNIQYILCDISLITREE